jgi:hypothetical protein
MKFVRPVLSVSLFVPGFAVLAMYAAYDERFSLWGGAAVGGAVGLLFAAAEEGQTSPQPAAVAPCEVRCELSPWSSRCGVGEEPPTPDLFVEVTNATAKPVREARGPLVVFRVYDAAGEMVATRGSPPSHARGASPSRSSRQTTGFSGSWGSDPDGLHPYHHRPLCTPKGKKKNDQVPP